MKVIKVLASLILTLLMMCSCRKEDAPKIYSFQRMETVWDKMLLSDMQREASSVTSVDFQFNIADDTQEQIAQIQSAVRKGADAIIVNPFDKESLVPVIEEAYDAGVFVVLVGQKIPTFKYHAYSGIDNRVLGDMAAKYICKLLDGKGNVVLIHSFRDAPFYRERTEAFDHVMNHYPEINIVGQVDAQWDKEKAHLMMDSLNLNYS